MSIPHLYKCAWCGTLAHMSTKLEPGGFWPCKCGHTLSFYDAYTHQYEPVIPQPDQCKHVFGISTVNGNFKCIHCGFERPSYEKLPLYGFEPTTGIDAAAMVFAKGFYQDAIKWEELSAQSRDNLRDGIRAILDAAPPVNADEFKAMRLLIDKAELWKQDSADGYNVAADHLVDDLAQHFGTRPTHGQYGKKAAVQTVEPDAKRQPPPIGFNDAANAYVGKIGNNYGIGAQLETAEQAREAAHLLNQIAEYLDALDG